MKLLPVVLLNLALVVMALVVYDQLRGPAAIPGVLDEGGGAETTALERRIRILEAERRPEGPDHRILERLAAVEEAVRQRVAIDVPPEAAPDPTEPVRDDAPSALASPDDPSPDSVRMFRRLQEAVRREESMKRNKARVDGILDGLGISLGEKQRTRILAAYAAFEPRKTEIWTEAKSQAQKSAGTGGAVDRREIVAVTTAAIQQEFAEMIGGFVPAGDAEAIAKALHPR